MGGHEEIQTVAADLFTTQTLIQLLNKKHHLFINIGLTSSWKKFVLVHELNPLSYDS